MPNYNIFSAYFAIQIGDSMKERPAYLKIYDYLKESILNGQRKKDEKLPSLRELSRELSVSITTVELAYTQLLVEGYIYSKAKSGYYVEDISLAGFPEGLTGPASVADSIDEKISSPSYLYDPACFDFNKWKRCMNKVLTEQSGFLMFDSDPQGELVLRREISAYLRRMRGVICSPDQIVIGAGTQQITGQLSLILRHMDINHISFEEPGYTPVRNIFRDHGFTISPTAVKGDGIDIDKLPRNIRSAVYISPSNQFPTGAVMPVGKRGKILEWAQKNESIIIEDDYDSELRYSGQPLPAMQGLDRAGCVVYLGSFSATLFSSLKISYMVLPVRLTEIFKRTKQDYVQTCSKTEQLTLSLFMQQGLFHIHLKKLRRLYAQKLQRVIRTIEKYGDTFLVTRNTASGMNIIIDVKSRKDGAALSAEAAKLGILALPVSTFSSGPAFDTAGFVSMILYYNHIPLAEIEEAIGGLFALWNN